MVIIINVNYDKSGIHLSMSLSQCSAIYGQMKICVQNVQEDCIRDFINDICKKVFFFQAKVLWFIRTLWNILINEVD